ncbi:hypothetical protein PROFUN_14662 [Planoprotostelium fungivorum]|uniref:Uncharacterized protein n=1 Tax=Planoprotostelium fungivorum TaxID=1890364 RepID=A0A2P6MZ31_9EUKA|nr:hypothetical protein PROFUN_14662 [Planoprotostelium fungivorum]
MTEITKLGLGHVNLNMQGSLPQVLLLKEIPNEQTVLRSLLSQKQVRKLVVMPRVESHGLHGGVFSFFVRTNIAEKRRVPGLFSQFPRVEVPKTYVEMVTKPPSNHYHQR